MLMKREKPRLRGCEDERKTMTGVEMMRIRERERQLKESLRPKQKQAQAAASRNQKADRDNNSPGQKSHVGSSNVFRCSSLASPLEVLILLDLTSHIHPHRQQLHPDRARLRRLGRSSNCLYHNDKRTRVPAVQTQ
jgi:hypothetical protein